MLPYVLEGPYNIKCLKTIIKLLSCPTHTSGQVNMCCHGGFLEVLLPFWGTYVLVKGSLLEEIRDPIVTSLSKMGMCWFICGLCIQWSVSQGGADSNDTWIQKSKLLQVLPFSKGEE